MCVGFFYLFTDNMLHYKVILHVPVFLILYYVLLYNKIRSSEEWRRELDPAHAPTQHSLQAH